MDPNLAEIRAVLRGGSGRSKIVLTYVFGHGLCVQVYDRSRKVGPVMIPDREGGQSLGDLLKLLGDLVESEDE